MPAPARNINNELTGQIISIVCEVWNVSRHDIVSRSHKRPLPWAREQLCEYLRRYAGHDSVSCAAILKISPRTITEYSQHYPTIRRTYTPFRNCDEKIKQRIKALLQCEPTTK